MLDKVSRLGYEGFAMEGRNRRDKLCDQLTGTGLEQVGPDLRVVPVGGDPLRVYSWHKRRTFKGKLCAGRGVTTRVKIVDKLCRTCRYALKRCLRFGHQLGERIGLL